MAIQKKISRENLRRVQGAAPHTALIEGPSKDNPLVWEARLAGMAPDIDGKIYLTDIELPDGAMWPATGRCGARRDHQDGRLRFDRARGGDFAATRALRRDGLSALQVRCRENLHRIATAPARDSSGAASA